MLPYMATVEQVGRLSSQATKKNPVDAIRLQPSVRHGKEIGTAPEDD